jgi:4-phytase/acid phosphatase
LKRVWKSLPAALLLSVACTAQQPQLKLVVVLTRHGVRSPTWTNQRLDAYSALPWPQWSVQPGYLTPRGFDLLTSFGAYDRAAWSTSGLLSKTGCADASAVYIYADTDQRTLESGRALAQGLYPGCEPSVHSQAGGGNDPLFHPVANASPLQTANVTAEVKQQLATLPPTEALLLDLDRVLRGCNVSANAPCQPEHPPATPLLGAPSAVVAGHGDHLVDIQGPMPTASTLSEVLLLEYADARPMSEVGWGHVDQPKLRRLLNLHTAYFQLLHRTPSLATMEATPLLQTIARTLQQGATGKPVAGALGVPTQRVVLLAGHDSNIAALAALLGVHWQLDGRTDDTPPGTELQFELWQSPQGPWTVRLRVAMQTLDQLRTNAPLTLAAPPAQMELTSEKIAGLLR